MTLSGVPVPRHDDIPMCDAMAHIDEDYCGGFLEGDEDFLAAAGFNHETTVSAAISHESVMLSYGYQLLGEDDE